MATTSCTLALLCLAVATTAGAQTSVLTYHNDMARTGASLAETILTPANVAAGHFGKLFAQQVDGDLYAQPLYVPKLAIPGKGTHDVVFVATEADSVYALDADSPSGADAGVLWHVSLLDSAHGALAGATAVAARGDLNCTTIAPQVGITATPVIDAAHGTVYVEAFSKENGAFIHRLHALDITTGLERKGSPLVVSAATDVAFNPLRELDRAGVLLSGDRVYVSYGSTCDRPVHQGWIFAYDAQSLAARGVFVTSREHGKAAIWMSGAAPAADTHGNVFVATGDGFFDTTTPTPREFGDSILKLSPYGTGLTLADYFTPFNQLLLGRHDGDLGSGGVLLLPDQPGGHPHVLVEVGKAGTLYVVDRDTLTAGNLHYCADCSADRQIVQEVPAAITGGVWGGAGLLE